MTFIQLSYILTFNELYEVCWSLARLEIYFTIPTSPQVAKKTGMISFKIARWSMPRLWIINNNQVSELQEKFRNIWLVRRETLVEKLKWLRRATGRTRLYSPKPPPSLLLCTIIFSLLIILMVERATLNRKRKWMVIDTLLHSSY